MPRNADAQNDHACTLDCHNLRLPVFDATTATRIELRHGGDVLEDFRIGVQTRGPEFAATGEPFPQAGMITAHVVSPDPAWWRRMTSMP